MENQKICNVQFSVVSNNVPQSEMNMLEQHGLSIHWSRRFFASKSYSVDEEGYLGTFEESLPTVTLSIDAAAFENRRAFDGARHILQGIALSGGMPKKVKLVLEVLVDGTASVIKLDFRPSEKHRFLDLAPILEKLPHQVELGV